MYLSLKRSCAFVGREKAHSDPWEELVANTANARATMRHISRDGLIPREVPFASHIETTKAAFHVNKTGRYVTE